jgi:hypothetical protein
MGPPPIEGDLFKADSGASGGAFVGDYIAAGAQVLEFDFLAKDYMPSFIELQFYAGSHGEEGGGDHIWYLSLDNPGSVGNWEHYISPSHYPWPCTSA